MEGDSELPIINGKHYHIGCGVGDLEKYIITCGAPERAIKISKYFDKNSIRFKTKHREFLTFTGTYKGIPLSVMSTGMGPDNTAMVVIETSQIRKDAVFIRCGSSGGIGKGVEVGDLVIAKKALSYEEVSKNYLNFFQRLKYFNFKIWNLIFPSSPEITKALIKSASKLKIPYHVGITASTSDFYGDQGRQIPGFFLSKKALNRVKNAYRKKALNFEMEMSVYFALTNISTYDIKAGGICAVYADRNKRHIMTTKEIVKAEKNCIRTVLGAIEILAKE